MDMRNVIPFRQAGPPSSEQPSERQELAVLLLFNLFALLHFKRRRPSNPEIDACIGVLEQLRPDK